MTSSIHIKNKLELQPASKDALTQLAHINDWIKTFAQVPIVTHHIIHGGLYARTIHLDPGTVIMGALIDKPTILIINGPVSMLSGNQRVELTGYNVIPGCAGRKQLFVTRGAVDMTMIASTAYRTVSDVEDELFVDADQLVSRRDGDNDTTQITGE